MDSNDELVKSVKSVEIVDIELVDILMRQTTYTKEEAIQSLKENNNNIEKCIELFLEIKPKKQAEMSINQKIFKNIRDNM